MDVLLAIDITDSENSLEANGGSPLLTDMRLENKSPGIMTSTCRDNVDLLTVDRALGASAGAVAAVALLLPDHMSTTMLREKFFSVVKDAESRPFGAFNPK